MKPTKALIAIDPGQSGAMAWRIGCGPVQARGFPQSTKSQTAEARMLAMFKDALRGVDEATVYFEELTGFQRGRTNTGASMFAMGNSYGFLKCCCLMYNLRVVWVAPVTWQASLAIDKPRKLEYEEWKDLLYQRALIEYPGFEFSKRCSDALLILRHAEGRECLK